MPKAKRIWTIKDVAGEGGEGPEHRDDDPPFSSNAPAPANPWSSQPSDPYRATAAPSSAPSAASTVKCCHIPNLSRAMQARDMLERIMAEFEPIIHRRKYNVRSVSEFCCCADGLDFEPGSRRKRPKQPSNLLGYNQTSTTNYGKFHTIHIRLRHPANHAMFKLYEDVAGTMAHELAHCEIGPHNDKFFKLMDEIIDEHASLMASKLTRDGLPMLAFGTTGQVLGGQHISLEDSRKQQQAKNSVGRVLGGDTSFVQWMTPREAAVAAADARRRQAQMRLRGELCCRPCLIDVDAESGSSDGVVGDTAAGSSRSSQSDTNGGDKKRPSNSTVLDDVENRKPRAKTAGDKRTERKKGDTCRTVDSVTVKVEDIIDLTCDDDDLAAVSAAAASRVPTAASGSWSCVRCTFGNQLEVTLCALCYTERDWHTF